jgi:hypothetical protein
VHRRILGPVNDNEEENWRILTKKEIYAMVKNPHYNRDNNVKEITLVWACTENGKNRITKKVLGTNLEKKRLRGRPRNRLQDKVRENRKLVGAKGWQERIYNREE